MRKITENPSEKDIATRKKALRIRRPPLKLSASPNALHLSQHYQKGWCVNKLMYPLRCHHWQCVASCKDFVISLAQQKFRYLKAGFQQDTTDSKHSTSVNPSNNSTCNFSCWGLACILAWREAACTCQIFSGLRLPCGFSLFFPVNWSRNKNQELRNTKTDCRDKTIGFLKSTRPLLQVLLWKSRGECFPPDSQLQIRVPPVGLKGSTWPWGFLAKSLWPIKTVIASPQHSCWSFKVYWCLFSWHLSF